MTKPMQLFVIAILALSGVANAQTQPVSVDCPAYAVGDQWTFENTNLLKKVTTESSLEVSKISGDVNEFTRRSANGAASIGTETSETNTIVRGNTSYSPHSGFMAFPLRVAKTWSVNSDFRIEGSYYGKNDLTAQVVGWEEVRVPAGTFNALKIEWKGSYTSTTIDNMRHGTGRIVQTVWYVPEVKRAVKVQYDDTDWNGRPATASVTVLKAYKVN